MSSGHIRARGPGAFELKYDLPSTDGKRRTRTTTFRGTIKEARRRLRSLLLAVDRGEAVEPSKITVAALARERIARWEVSPSTKETYENDLKMLGSIGNIHAQRLGTRDVEGWHSELRSRGLSPTTIRKAHALLRRVLGEAHRHGLVARNVAADQPLAKAKRAAKVEIVRSEAVPELLEKLRGDPFEVPVIVALYTGVRRGEMLALRWSDVDLDGRDHDDQPGARGDHIRG